MAFLTIAGIDVPVESSAKAIERIGTSERAFAGNLRSAVRAEKRAWTVVTTLLLNADAAAIEAAVDFAEHVTCSGDILGGSVTCEATVVDSQYASFHGGDGLGFMRALQLLVREV